MLLSCLLHLEFIITLILDQSGRQNADDTLQLWLILFRNFDLSASFLIFNLMSLVLPSSLLLVDRHSLVYTSLENILYSEIAIIVLALVSSSFSFKPNKKLLFHRHLNLHYPRMAAATT